MTHQEQDDLIKMVNETITELEEVVKFVRNNHHRSECRPVNAADCEYKLKYQKASIKEVTESLLFLI